VRTIVFSSFAAIAAIAIGVGPASAQAHDPAKPHHDEAAAQTQKRVGDPYPFDTCPITGKKLGAMGDPVVALYDGREVRFCCPACPKKFDQDKAANLAKLDEKIVKDQLAIYPLKTSVVNGKALPDKPVDVVYGNRLVRVSDEADKAEFMKDPAKHLAALNKAVIEQQGKNYPLMTCPVSGDKYGGDMGDPKDVVIAGRLLRLCCNDCRKELEKDPAKFIAKVDEARKGKAGKPEDAHHGDHDHGGH
jgi:YHS domain-containing protein